MFQFLNFVVHGLATWRLTRFVQEEVGPLHAMLRLREAVGIKHDPDTDQPISWPNDGKVAEALGCVYCTSIWMAGVLYFCPSWVRSILAASALAILVHESRSWAWGR